MEEPQEKKNEFWLKYLQIPVEVFVNKDLTDVEMKLFALIDILDGDEGCYARNEYIASILNVTPTTISTGISKLKKFKYLKQINFDGRYRTIKIDPTYKQTYKQALNELKGRIKAGLNHKSIKEDNKKENFSSLFKEENNDFQESQPPQPFLERPSIDISTNVKGKGIAPPQGIIKKSNRPTRESAPEPVQKGLLGYGAASQDACFLVSHWNSLPTTPNHKLNSKTVESTLYLLDNKLLRNYGQKEIERVMDEFSEMQQNARMYDVTPKKISIGDFFSGNGYLNLSRHVAGKEPQQPWFQRLIVPSSYKQFLKREDPNQELTDKIKEQYQRHVLHEEVEFTPKQESQFMEAARRLKAYMDKGHRLEGYVDGADTGDYIRMVFEALEGEFEGVVQIGNLCSKYTWDNVFPRFLTKHYESSQFY